MTYWKRHRVHSFSGDCTTGPRPPHRGLASWSTGLLVFLIELHRIHEISDHPWDSWPSMRYLASVRFPASVRFLAFMKVLPSMIVLTIHKIPSIHGTLNICKIPNHPWNSYHPCDWFLTIHKIPSIHEISSIYEILSIHEIYSIYEIPTIHEISSIHKIPSIHEIPNQPWNEIPSINEIPNHSQHSQHPETPSIHEFPSTLSAIPQKTTSTYHTSSVSVAGKWPSCTSSPPGSAPAGSRQKFQPEMLKMLPVLSEPFWPRFRNHPRWARPELLGSVEHCLKGTWNVQQIKNANHLL